MLLYSVSEQEDSLQKQNRWYIVQPVQVGERILQQKKERKGLSDWKSLQAAYQSIFESVGSGRSIIYDAHELLYVGVTAGLDRQIHGSLTKLGQSTDDYDVLYRKASYHKFMFRKKLHVQKANRSSVLSTGAGASFAL